MPTRSQLLLVEMSARMKIEEKGKKIFDEGKAAKTIETDKRAHFEVFGDTDTHSVIFDKVKGKWSCDCKYSALQNKDCSHVVACKLLSKE